MDSFDLVVRVQILSTSSQRIQRPSAGVMELCMWCPSLAYVWSRLTWGALIVHPLIHIRLGALSCAKMRGQKTHSENEFTEKQT